MSRRPDRLLTGADLPAEARPSVPQALSVTNVVCYARCPLQFYWTVVRPRRRQPSDAARLGSEVHKWIEQRAGRQLTLLAAHDELDPDALPPDPDVALALKASFLASPYADLDPVRVEAPFELRAGGRAVRGRVDAIYERDGRLELVDFKTGRPPVDRDRAADLQLELYALAAVECWGADAAQVRTTYCYLRTDEPPATVTVDWERDTAARVRDDLVAALEAMNDRWFRPRTGRWCERCDFLGFCRAGQAEMARRPGPPVS